MEEQNTTINGLPNDLLTYVMVNLGQALLIGAVASVCRRWAAHMPHVVVEVAGRDGITLSGDDQCTVQLLGALQHDLKKSSVLLQRITSNPLDGLQRQGRQRRQYTYARLISLQQWGQLNWRVKRVHLERLLAHLEFMCAREKTVVFRILCNLDSESLSPHKTLIASYVPWRHHDSPSPLMRRPLGRTTDFQAYAVQALIKIDGATQEHFTDILDWMKTPSASLYMVGANVITDMYNVLNEEQLDQFMDVVLPMAFRQSNPPLLRSSALSMLSKVHITKIALYASDMIDMFSVLPELGSYTKIASLLLHLNENTLKPHLLDIINKLSARKHGFVFWELLDKFDSATLSQYDAILRVAAEENDLGPTAHRVLAKLNPST